MTVPNILTCFRIIMALAAAVAFALYDARAAATFLCIIASMLDYFDGWYARRFHRSTSLGAHLDPFADKVLISVVFLCLAFTFRWPWFTFFVAIILLREALITIYRVVVRRRSGVLTPASSLGRVKTALQCLVGGFLMFFVFVYPARIPSHSWLIFSLMMLTLFVTVDSGMMYLLPCCSDGKKRSVLERLSQRILGVRAREV